MTTTMIVFVWLGSLKVHFCYVAHQSLNWQLTNNAFLFLPKNVKTSLFLHKFVFHFYSSKNNEFFVCRLGQGILCLRNATKNPKNWLVTVVYPHLLVEIILLVVKQVFPSFSITNGKIRRKSAPSRGGLEVELALHI